MKISNNKGLKIDLCRTSNNTILHKLYLSFIFTLCFLSESTIPSRCILVPFEWYGHPKKCTPKVLMTFFLYIFHVKTKWNIVYEYLKTKIFWRDTNALPQMHWTSNIFGYSATIIGGFWVSLNYPIVNFKKKLCPKNIWMWNWKGNYILILKNFCQNHMHLA